MGYNLNLNSGGMSSFKLKLDPGMCEHVARRGPHIELKLKVGPKMNYGKKEPIFLVRPREREKKKKKDESQGFLPRSTEFCWSVFVRPRMKVHRIDEGYV